MLLILLYLIYNIKETIEIEQKIFKKEKEKNYYV